jgi:hypothetical protein
MPATQQFCMPYPEPVPHSFDAALATLIAEANDHKQNTRQYDQIKALQSYSWIDLYGDIDSDYSTHEACCINMCSGNCSALHLLPESQQIMK